MCFINDVYISWNGCWRQGAKEMPISYKVIWNWQVAFHPNNCKLLVLRAPIALSLFYEILPPRLFSHMVSRHNQPTSPWQFNSPVGISMSNLCVECFIEGISEITRKIYSLQLGLDGHHLNYPLFILCCCFCWCSRSSRKMLVGIRTSDAKYTTEINSISLQRIKWHCCQKYKDILD